MSLFETCRSIIKKSPAESCMRNFYSNFVPLIYRDMLSRRYVNPYSSLEDKYHVIFVHVPKNAGNGVAHSLFGMDPKGHNFLIDYKRKDQNKFDNYFKFGFSRNVYSRFYSAYSYLKKGGFGVYDDEFANKFLRKYSSFNDFVWAMEDPYFAKCVLSWTHFIPQIDFFFIDGNCGLDYLGSVEDMDSSLKYISDYLGIELKGNQRVNSSDTENYKNNFSSKSVDIISMLYKEDIKFLGCDF